jgi:hypothetical protein
VKLEGHEPKTLTVKGKLVDRALEVLSIDNDEPLGCVQFGSTYYGCDRTECALLYNNSPESVNFVAVLDEDAVAQEMVRMKEDFRRRKLLEEQYLEKQLWKAVQ